MCGYVEKKGRGWKANRSISTVFNQRVICYVNIMVVQPLVLLPHNLTVPNSILNSGYCLCRGSHFLHMSTSVFTGSPTNIVIRGLARRTCPKCEYVWTVLRA